MPLLFGGCANASAQNSNSLSVYLGYADSGSAASHQLAPTFPSPWQGSSKVRFIGGGNQFDAGAIRIHNPTDKDVALQSATVDIDQKHYDLWAAAGLTVPADGDLILTQTKIIQPNPILTDFDSSEAAGETCTPAQPGGKPVVHLALAGHTTNITDNDKILSTGGRDLGKCAGKPNESHQWDLVGNVSIPGTTSAQSSSSGIGDPWLLGLTGGLIALLSFIPALLGALLLLLIGWFLARWLGRLLAAVIDRIGFGPAVERTGLLGFVGKRDRRRTNAAWLLGLLFTLFIFLFFVVMAAQALHLGAITGFVDAVALWLPKLIAALVVLFVGALLARIFGGLVRGVAAQSGFNNPELFANIARMAVLAFAVIVALDQSGIAKQFMQLLFAALAFTLALAIGLAFGLGGRDTAAQILQRWYGRRGTMPPAPR